MYVIDFDFGVCCEYVGTLSEEVYDKVYPLLEKIAKERGGVLIESLVE